EFLLKYCEADIGGPERLFTAMESLIAWPYALLRGRYTAAVAWMEHHGVPIDTQSLKILIDRWESIQDILISRVDADRGIFEGRTFSQKRFAEYLIRAGLPWPRYESGSFKLDSETFDEMTKMYPQQIGAIRELRNNLAQMRLTSLQVGRDGRNRTLLSQFC